MPRSVPPSGDLFFEDFYSGTMQMRACQVGMYMRLLCQQWSLGVLPDDDYDLARMAGVSDDEWGQHKAKVLAKFLRCEEGGLQHPRLADIRAKAIARCRANATNGRLGGRPPNNPSLSKTKTQNEPTREVGGGKWEEEARKVVAHYQKQHSRWKPDAADLDQIAARLSDGWSVQDLVDAIDGCHVSKFHCGENDQKRKHQSLELITRDSKHVQQFIEIFEDQIRGDRKSRNQDSAKRLQVLIYRELKAGRGDRDWSDVEWVKYFRGQGEV